MTYSGIDVSIFMHKIADGDPYLLYKKLFHHTPTNDHRALNSKTLILINPTHLRMQNCNLCSLSSTTVPWLISTIAPLPPYQHARHATTSTGDQDEFVALQELERSDAHRTTNENLVFQGIEVDWSRRYYRTKNADGETIKILVGKNNATLIHTRTCTQKYINKTIENTFFQGIKVDWSRRIYRTKNADGETIKIRVGKDGATLIHTISGTQKHMNKTNTKTLFSKASKSPVAATTIEKRVTTKTQ